MSLSLFTLRRGVKPFYAEIIKEMKRYTRETGGKKGGKR
jgi:hypothetical protein